MDSVIIISLSIKMVLALSGVLFVWGMFRLLDIVAGKPFTLALEKMYEDPSALAVYYGCRFIGACVLIGFVLS